MALPEGAGGDVDCGVGRGIDWVVRSEWNRVGHQGYGVGGGSSAGGIGSMDSLWQEMSRREIHTIRNLVM